MVGRVATGSCRFEAEFMKTACWPRPRSKKRRGARGAVFKEPGEIDGTAVSKLEWKFDYVSENEQPQP